LEIPKPAREDEEYMMNRDDFPSIHDTRTSARILCGISENWKKRSLPSSWVAQSMVL